MVMEMTEAEFNMYGMSKADIDNQFHWMLKATGTEMTVVSLLSDVQHIMEHGDTERARKWINIAKRLLIDKIEAERKAA